MRKIAVAYEPRNISVEVNNRKCLMCKKPYQYERGRYMDNPDNNACSDCQFWMDLWKIKDEPTTVRINRNHYIVGRPTDKHKGMGGTQVRIVFNDGREVVTDNLWHQGEIPEVWRGYGLGDNAGFGELL